MNLLEEIYYNKDNEIDDNIHIVLDKNNNNNCSKSELHKYSIANVIKEGKLFMKRNNTISINIRNVPELSVLTCLL